MPKGYGLEGADAAMSEKERRRLRMENAAEKILETVLRRRRWTATDRDRIAEVIEQAAIEEVKIMRNRGAGR